jgi:hypothetical protein
MKDVEEEHRIPAVRPSRRHLVAVFAVLAAGVALLILIWPSGDTPKEVMWHLASAPVGRDLDLTAMGGGCITGVDRVIAEETLKSLRLRVLVRTTGDGDCHLDLRMLPTRVRLAEPLGNRTLLGECQPGDSSPDERICASLASFTTRSP